MMELSFIIIQAVGFIGLFFAILSFQKDKRSFTLKSHLTAALFFAFHFALLGAWSGAVMNVISGGRAYVFNLKGTAIQNNKNTKSSVSKKTNKKNKKINWANKKIVLYIFIALFWIGGLLSWHGFISLLPIIAMTTDCFAFWSRNTKYIRWLFLVGRPLWITYNVLVGSYAGVAAELFVLTSVCVGIFRFDFLKK